MSQTGVVAWSQTAASNSTADVNVNWAEGMAPSAVNDSARAEMASVAKYRDDTAGTLTTAGTSTAYTLTTNQVFSALTVLNGQELSIKFNATNGAAPTLNVDGLGAKAINVDTATAVGTGVIKADSVWNVVYDNSNTCFILKAVPASVQDGTVNTASIAANAVTLAKMATQADQTLLGNIAGSTAVPTAITIGAGLTAASGTIKSAFPPPGAFKNLSIKVLSTTTVAVTADYVTTTNGTTYQTTAVNSTVNLGTTGADALDTGTIAIDTFYAIWVIAKTDGTTKCLASTSSTTPTMPSGYTFKARVGWVRTIHASATLYGTYQLGGRAQYIVGLAQTTAAVIIDSGIKGTPTTPTWSAVSVASYVPSTASAIIVSLTVNDTSANAICAPNSSYGGSKSTTNPPPMTLLNGASGFAGFNTTTTATLLLESTSIYWASDTGTNRLVCIGWEDNI